MNYEKLHKCIQNALEYESDDYYIKINLKKDVSNKLFSYQFLHVINLINALRFNNIILDGSDTGTGKTYTTIAMCKQLNLKPLIICPKTVISVWWDVCKYFNIEPLAIINYETIKMGKQYDKNDTSVRSVSKFLELNNSDTYIWNLPKNSIIVFDEVHKCKNNRSMNGKLLMSTKDSKNKIIMLSATVADKPKSFAIFGFMLGFYNNFKRAPTWIKGILRDDINYIGSTPITSSLCKQIYPNKGARMSIKELGDQFPKMVISVTCYNADANIKNTINNSFKKIKELQNNNTLKDIQYQRMKIELAKLPILEELISDNLEAELNVAVFVNFKETLNRLAIKFNTDCIIYGDQDIETRDKNITRFQENVSNIILCTIQSGGSGISLHDKYGKQRISIISPCWSSVDFKQVLGRICRAGAKSSAIQKVVYCADTCEELVCKRLENKLKFMDKFKDEEIVDFNILNINDTDLCI